MIHRFVGTFLASGDIYCLQVIPKQRTPRYSFKNTRVFSIKKLGLRRPLLLQRSRKHCFFSLCFKKRSREVQRVSNKKTHFLYQLKLWGLVFRQFVHRSAGREQLWNDSDGKQREIKEQTWRLRLKSKSAEVNSSDFHCRRNRIEISLLLWENRQATSV